ncbi:MAG: anthranilate synthase component I [Thermomicrobiales bacterium]
MVASVTSKGSRQVAIDIQPSLAEVQRIAARVGPDIRTVPIYREVLADLETPVSVYLKLSDGAQLPGFLLESVEGGIRIARYSFIGAGAYTSLTMRDGLLTLAGADGTTQEPYQDPLTALGDVLSQYKAESDPDLPRFTGGVVGYLGYEAIRRFEPRVGRAKGDGLGLPEARYHLADTLVVFDHLQRSMKVVSHVRLDGDDLDVSYQNAVDNIDRLTEKLHGVPPAYELRPDTQTIPVVDRFRPNTSPERYREMVQRVQKYIGNGDIIQCVPSQRIDIDTDAHPFTIYRALRTVNPSPYMFFLDFGDHHIVGASPELLVRCEDGIITNHPIAGTRPRGQTPAEDVALAEELIADEKERAEHIMLVDLGRNDVGRISKAGSVRVPRLMEIERFSHVMHIVSSVEGELREDLTSLDAFRSCFPAGTVSGAPKIRAMEIIAELETDVRGAYAGAVGYVDFAGGMDTCIALRTMVVRDGVASLQAGGGVVADSSPEGEYAETLHKMRALVRAIEKAEHIERTDLARSGGTRS